MITKQYYIIGVQEDNRQNLKELTLSDIKIIEESCSVIYKFNYFDKRDIEIQENLNEFLKVYENSKKIIQSTSDRELRNGILDLIFININRTFTNYLSSYKIQVDHFENYFKSKYGVESIEYKKFKGYCNMIYDESFTYRLFYNLRNYSQHIYFPLNRITKESINDKNMHKINLLVCFDKKMLMQDIKINKKLSLDFAKCNDFIPVMVHINNSKKIREEFFKMFINIEKTSLQLHSQIIKEFTTIVPKNMEATYGYWEWSKSKTTICSANLFPLDVIERLNLRLIEMGLCI